MENKEHLQTPFPKGMAKDMYCARMGKIAFALTIAASVVSLFSLMSAVVPYIIAGLIYFFAFAVMVLTLFAIFVYEPDFWTEIEESVNSFIEAAEYVQEIWRYSIPITIGIAAVAFLFLFLDRGVRHFSRHIALIVIAVFFAIAAIIKAAFV